MTTIDDLRQTFFEESTEGLEAINSGLNELSDSIASDETINAVFRGIHSIKGGAGVFGFSSLVDFAHVFETVLDQLRHGKLSPSPQVVEVLQRANDTLSDLVGMARAAETPPPNFDADSRSALKLLIGDGGEDEEDTAADFADMDFQPVLAADTASEPQQFNVAYRADEAQFDDKFIAVVTALGAAGRLEIGVGAESVPELDEYETRTPYLDCGGTIESELSLDGLRDVVVAIDTSDNWSLTQSTGSPPPAGSDTPLSDAESAAPAAAAGSMASAKPAAAASSGTCGGTRRSGRQGLGSNDNTRRSRKDRPCRQYGRRTGHLADNAGPTIRAYRWRYRRPVVPGYGGRIPAYPRAQRQRHGDPCPARSLGLPAHGAIGSGISVKTEKRSGWRPWARVLKSTRPSSTD